ncbi:YopT-type cysteine protease domain-containing protein [Photorhabdus laumondii]|uniref:YopT-type cysteine protease domain-containing protein n=2 Tax=Morganellaceae TaxID=1903414 RepID=UPI000D633A84|nr:YopT-type cysteine protease domain-containing protein [Photorhabdus laumondii]AWK43404.1 cysteine protease [Photorhabdus laumondii subsp. laumondii]
MSPISSINHQRIFPTQQLDTTAVNQPQGELSGKSLKVSSPRPRLLERLSAAIQRNLPGHSMLDRQLTTDGKKNQESRFSFSMIKDRIVHFAVSTTLGSVRNSASKHGGEITFKFPQTKGTFLDQIMKHSDTSGGVCESISAHWISAHAKGESVFDQLYVGGQKGQFHIDSLVSIKQLQMDGIAQDVDQDTMTESWLSENGIQPRMKTITYQSANGPINYKRPIEVNGQTGSNGTSDLLNAILDTGDKGSSYKKISFSGQMAGHAVAAYVDDLKGVTFFDPNFGEFHFPNKESFSNWFSQDFWSKSMYNKEIGLGQHFQVLNYEPKTQ